MRGEQTVSELEREPVQMDPHCEGCGKSEAGGGLSETTRDLSGDMSACIALP